VGQGRAALEDQELAVKTGTSYWEGAVTYEGSAKGAGYLEMGLAALHEAGMENALLENVVFQEVLLLPKQGTRVAQVVLTPEVGGKRTFQVFSDNGKGGWTMHAHGQAGRGEAPAEEPCSLEAIRARCSAVRPLPVSATATDRDLG